MNTDDSMTEFTAEPIQPPDRGAGAGSAATAGDRFDQAPPDPLVPAGEPSSDDAIPQTGQLDVDAALGQLSELGGVPVAEHHDVMMRVHEALNDALNTAGEPTES